MIVYGQVESEQLDSPKSGRSGNIKNCSILPYKILQRTILLDSQFRGARNLAQSHDKICVVISKPGMRVEGWCRVKAMVSALKF